MGDTVSEDDHLYPIQHEPGWGIYAGGLPQGRQGLIGQPWDGSMVVATFDAQGKFLALLRKSVPQFDVLKREGSYEAAEAEFHYYLYREFGFQPGLIWVKAFRESREHIGVYRLPEAYQAFVDNPADPRFGEAERQDFQAAVERWLAESWFHLEWDGEKVLDSSGEVVAT